MQKLKELTDLAIELLAEGEKYLGTLSRSLEKKSRFGNDLLYSMTVMCCEKLFVALLYHYDEFAEHHMPIALYNDAAKVEPELTPEMRDTCRLINKFESICSIDGFGYKTPTDEDLKTMILGLQDIHALIVKRIRG